MGVIEDQVSTLTHDVKSFTGRYREDLKLIENRMDQIESKAVRPNLGDGTSVLEELRASSDLGKLIGQKKRGSVTFDLSARAVSEILSRKNITATGLGFGTPGVMPVDRDTGITIAPRPQLHMRDLISGRPTTAGEVVWLRESARPTKASPVTEGTGEKPLAYPTIEVEKEPVQTIAILTRASNQVLADLPELEGFLRDEFSALVWEEQDRQLLFGSGTPPDLHGVTTLAQSWDLSTLTASDGYEYIDILAGARQMVAAKNAEVGRPFFVVHPDDLWKMRRTKDSMGRYILGDPMSPFPPSLWGAPIADTTIMTKGYFLYGNGDARAAQIRDRQGLTIELSTEDGDNFRLNLVTIRTELRLAFVVKIPDSFVYGQFSQSPA